MNSEYHCESKPLYQLQVVQVVLFLLSILQIINWKWFLKNLFLFNLPSLHRCNQQSNFLRGYYRLLLVSVEKMLESIMKDINILSLMCTTQLSVGIPFRTQDLSSA